MGGNAVKIDLPPFWKGSTLHFRLDAFSEGCLKTDRKSQKLCPLVEMAENLLIVSSPFKSNQDLTSCPMSCNMITSQKHAYIILTSLNPTYIYSKTGVYKDIHYFSYFCSKT